MNRDLMFIAGAVIVGIVVLLIEAILAFFGEPNAVWLMRALGIKL